MYYVRSVPHFAAFSPRSLGRSLPIFATCSMVTQIYKIRSEIWVVLSPSKFVGPKTSKFRQLLDLIANIILRTQQDIVNRKTALQTTDTLAEANSIWCTLVHKRLKMDRSSDPPTGHSSEFRVQTTRVNKSVAFDRWRHWPNQRSSITLGCTTLSSCFSFPL